jgi:hypothetical protein
MANENSKGRWAVARLGPWSRDGAGWAVETPPTSATAVLASGRAARAEAENAVRAREREVTRDWRGDYEVRRYREADYPPAQERLAIHGID